MFGLKVVVVLCGYTLCTSLNRFYFTNLRINMGLRSCLSSDYSLCQVSINLNYYTNQNLIVKSIMIFKEFLLTN